ncbi:11266_t:CDS:2 [Gigaspora margarita]|uniref:11266_t:CDS:1 n=1 Tax=Gigaspora margarita TaxID=4874 RepID=A0ABN7UQT0_GIGMA|nr:11266_t:CDS:2 [Gigaspora margarita]
MSYQGGAYKPAPGQYGSGPSPTSPVPSFFDEVSSIQDMIKLVQDNITRIDELHSRSLGTFSEDEATKRQLESLTENTRNVLVQTKDKIRKLEALNLGLPPHTSDLAVRRAQTANLRQRFLETLQKYQNIEYQNRQKYRARMERQYKIVKPQATQEEIDAALDNDESGQFFAQSLLNSTRYGAAKDALREVQERHDDIKKIEKTISELVNLFQEMQMLVEAQDAPIAAIEEHAVQVTKDMESGVQHVEKALESAKGARKIKSAVAVEIIIVKVIQIPQLPQKVIVPAAHNGEQLDNLDNLYSNFSDGIE